MLRSNLNLKIGAVLLAIFLWFWVTMNPRSAPQTPEPAWQPPDIATVAARPVRVVVRTTGVPAPGLKLTSVQVEPRLVTIIGSSSRVGAVSEVETALLDLANASDGVPEELLLRVPAGVDVPNTTTVRVTVSFGRAGAAPQAAPSD